MAKHETPEDVKQWFLSQVAKLWPVTSGSLSLRRNSCIRKHCSACESGEGNLPKDSVVNISHVVTLNKSDLVEKIGSIPSQRVRQIMEGIKLLMEPREI